MGNELSGQSELFGNHTAKNAEVSQAKNETNVNWRPMLDPVFQRWMSDKYICSEFLEAVTGRKTGNLQIDTQPELAQPNTNLRKIRLDVKATDESFQIFNIEAQIKHNKDHADRALYYACMVICKQLETNDDFEQLKKTTVIFINRNNTNSGCFIETAKLLRESDYSVFNDKLKIIYINLNNLFVPKRKRKGDVPEIDPAIPEKLRVFALFCLLGHHEDKLDAIYEEQKLEFKELRKALGMKLKEIRGNVTIQDQIAMYNDFYGEREEDLPVDIIDAIEARGIARGEARGIARGKVLTLWDELKWSVEKIARKVGITEDEVRKILDEA
jgi:predicted transposase/invertase (TIGR01784 family)